MIQLVLIFCATASALLGAIVLFHDARKTLNILAAGINFCIAIWSMAIVLFIDTSNIQSAHLYAQTYYSAAAVFVGLLVLFSGVFPNDKGLTYRRQAIVAALTMLILLCIGLVPNFIIDEAVIGSDGNYIAINPISYLVYSGFFITFFLYAMQVIAKKFLVSARKFRSQTGAYLLGILAMSIPGFVTNLILPFYEVYKFIWVAPAMGVFFLGVVTYSIMRHGLFDLRMAAVRSTAYLLSLATLAFVYYALIMAISGVLFEGVSTERLFLSTTLAIGVALIFQPVKHFFDVVTSTFFYRNSYTSESFFSRLNELLVRNTDMTRMLERTSLYIQSVLHSRQVYFYVFRHEDKRHDFSIGTPHHSRMAKQDVEELSAYVERTGNVAIATHFLSSDDRFMKRLLHSNKIEVAIPLARSGEAVGYLFVGESKGGKYTARDIRVLRTISDELVIAIQNALAVQQVRDLNNTLQQRIDDATKELRRSNTQLQRLDEAKDEFVSMASHQLRTPLTSVKGYLDMVLEGDAGEITDMQKHLLSEAFTSSERMVHLINDFLNVSRLQTGKFIIEKTKVDLKKLIEQEVSSLRLSATQRQLSFKVVMKGAIPVLMLDEGKMRQVVMNFLDNSLYYSRSDTVIQVRLEKDDDCISFTVKDTGIGVPEKEQGHLFTKFYRASNARKQRPDGTGVGLFLAKKVITAHSGRVIFTSTEGKGSTFGFSVPIKSLLPADRR